MPYATQQDMIDRFGEDELIQLTDRQNTDAIDTTVLDEALSDATEELDTFIGAAYRLPLSSTPKILVRWCADVARYHLYDDAVPDAVQSRYDAVRSNLKMLAKGQTTLGLDTDEQTAATGAPVVTTDAPGITDGDLGDYRGAL